MPLVIKGLRTSCQFCNIVRIDWQIVLTHLLCSLITNNIEIVPCFLCRKLEFTCLQAVSCYTAMLNCYRCSVNGLLSVPSFTLRVIVK